MKKLINFFSTGLCAILLMCSCGNKEDSKDVEIMSLEEKTLETTTPDSIALEERDSLTGKTAAQKDSSEIKNDSIRSLQDSVGEKPGG